MTLAENKYICSESVASWVIFSKKKYLNKLIKVNLGHSTLNVKYLLFLFGLSNGQLNAFFQAFGLIMST